MISHLTKQWQLGKRLVAVAVFGLLLSACSSNIFYPSQRQWQITPDALDYPFHNTFITSKDGLQLNLWQVLTHQQRKGAILYLHGNSQNISHHIPQIAWLLDAGFDVVMFDYRGFGHSQGTLSLQKTIGDIKLLAQWFIQQYPDDSKWFLGQSLGAALGSFVLGSNQSISQQFDGLILDSGFASFQKIGKDVFARHWFTWGLQYPFSWLMPKGYDAEKVIGNIAPTPIFILHSKDDFVVPYHHAEQLYSRANEPKYLLQYNGWHIDGFQNHNVRQQVLAFMRANALKR